MIRQVFKRKRSAECWQFSHCEGSKAIAFQSFEHQVEMGQHRPRRGTLWVVGRLMVKNNESHRLIMSARFGVEQVSGTETSRITRTIRSCLKLRI